jgi:ribosome modulation factor
MTPQEQRDQDYLAGYGAGIAGRDLTQHEAYNKPISFVRGWRDGRKDWHSANALASSLVVRQQTRGANP